MENVRDASHRKRSFTLPRKMPTSESQSEIDNVGGNNDKLAAAANGNSNESKDGEKKVRVATVRRSQSDRRAQPGGYDSTDYGGNVSDGSRQRSDSSGE